MFGYAVCFDFEVFIYFLFRFMVFIFSNCLFVLFFIFNIVKEFSCFVHINAYSCASLL